MSENETAPPAPVATPAAPARRVNGVGIAALVVGIIALGGSFIPLVNYGTAFLALVGVVLGIIGVSLRNRARGIALAGLIVSAAALIVSVVLAVTYTVQLLGAVDDVVGGIDVPTGAQTVVYEVEGTSTSTVISWTAFDTSTPTSEQTADQPLPWSQSYDVDIPNEAFAAGFVVTVQNPPDETGAITCRLRIGDQVIAEQTASGADAQVICTPIDLGAIDQGIPD